MNEEMKILQDERKQLFSDFYGNKIPKRMPLSIALNSNIVATYGGVDVFEYQYDFSKMAGPAKKVCDEIYSDTAVATPVNLVLTRPPSFYQTLGSQSFIMGSQGFVQHPEVVGMLETEYDELIADPYAFILEKVLPRQYKELNLDDPIGMLSRMNMAKATYDQDVAASLGWYRDLIDEYGYYPGAPMGSSGFTEAPYDFIADQLRSFSGVSMDIRRHKTQLKEACEAILPMMFRMGLPANAHPEGSVFTPLHMPTFMREKDFMDVWMPTYKKMFEQYAALGVRGKAFCEDDWMRYLDNLMELPAGTVLMFEYGNFQEIKDKLGKKFLITGLYPVSLLKTGTKQQVLDKAKELLDIMLPGGGYTFGFDKSPLTLRDINMENVRALSHFIHEYAVYDNPGEAFGTPLNSEKFAIDPEITNFKSKYLFDWKEFKQKYPNVPESARGRFEEADKKMFDIATLMLV